MVARALEVLFEEQVEFRLLDGTSVGGVVAVGGTQFLALQVLQDDKPAYRSEFSRWQEEEWSPEMRERRAPILDIPGNGDRYADLVAAHARQQVVPLIGSGMSVPTGLPTWPALLRRIRPFTKVDADKLEELLAASAFEEAADLVASTTNRNLFDEKVEHSLRVGARAIAGAVRLLPEVFPSLVLTTNLDDVLEQCYGTCGVGFAHVLAGREIGRYRQLKGAKDKFLLKLHGDRRRMESRVLLTSEYESAYGRGSTTREELALIYRMTSILFLGCSLGPDRTVGLIHDVALEDERMPRHYAFLQTPASPDLRIEREHFLTERRIYPIWYEGPHDEAILALLAGLVADVGRPE